MLLFCTVHISRSQPDHIAVQRNRYWIDFGNAKDTGQVVLSTVGNVKQPESEIYLPVERIPFVTEQYGELLRISDTDDTPSCSLAEALEKQDLFINGSLAAAFCG